MESRFLNIVYPNYPKPKMNACLLSTWDHSANVDQSIEKKKI